MSSPELHLDLDEGLEVTREARNYNEWLYARARPYVGGRMLDLGAGIGTFTKLALAEGREVVALEPHVEYVTRLEAEFGSHPRAEIVHGSAEDLRDRAPRPFDSVVAFNVLEHIDDDLSTLRAVHDLLAPGGRLLLLVPAHPILYGEVDRSVGHFRRYQRGPLEKLLHAAGFRVETLRYVNPVGALGWLVSFRLRSPDRWPRGQYRLYDRVVPVLRRLDRVPSPFGLSVWAVARRG